MAVTFGTYLGYLCISGIHLPLTNPSPSLDWVRTTVLSQIYKVSKSSQACLSFKRMCPKCGASGIRDAISSGSRCSPKKAKKKKRKKKERKKSEMLNYRRQHVGSPQVKVKQASSQPCLCGNGQCLRGLGFIFLKLSLTIRIATVRSLEL